MRNWLMIIICLSWLTSCKTKQLQVEKSVEQRKEQRQTEKDSVFEVLQQIKTLSLGLSSSQDFELELFSADTIGNKPLIFEKIRSQQAKKSSCKAEKLASELRIIAFKTRPYIRITLKTKGLSARKKKLNKLPKNNHLTKLNR